MVRPRLVTDEALRAAARQVFLDEGIQAPVARIAERLGVSHAAVFERVGTKEQLLLDALAPGRPRALQAFTKAPPAQGADARLQSILLELLSFLRRVVPGLVMLRAAGLSPFTGAPPGATAPPLALRTALAAWLASAAAQGALVTLDADATAEGLLGALEARAFHAYVGGRSFAPGRDERFVSQLVRGLVARPS